MRRGVKEVVKAIRKKETGYVRFCAIRLQTRSLAPPSRFLKSVRFLGLDRLVVLAGDISPIDVITHVPILCEEAGIPYVYVPSKEDLGLAGATKRPTSCIMVTPKAGADFQEAYDEVYSTVQGLPVPV